jgi:tripartite-type tricarboxylate transporter receptor subunit TctC
MKKILAAAGCILLMLSGAAFSDDKFPNRLVDVIVPFPPGGATDNPARILGEGLSNKWKQPVVVNNRAGAGGGVGTGYVSRAAADGYTLLVTHPGLISMPESERLFGRTPPFSTTDFTPLALLVADPTVVVVRADSPWKTYADLVEAAKKKPDSITYASSGVYSALHLPIEMLSHAAGIKLTHVPYKGGGPAITAVMAGEVDATCGVPAALEQYIKRGVLRPLVVTGAKRLAALPNVPTAIELGYKDVEFYLWVGTFAHAKTPEPLVKKIRADIARVVKDDPNFSQRMVKIGAPLDYRDGPAFAEFLKEDTKRIKAAIQRIGKVD